MTGIATRCAWLLAVLVSTAQAANTLVPEGVIRYAPNGFPERIVALPSADPRTGFAVAWRTDASVSAPLMQIAEAIDSPDLAAVAREVRATTRVLNTENGKAHHHRADVSDLRPDTLYAFRVQGRDTWSEWFQLRTAAATDRPFTFLYFGDAQNSVKSLYSRVIRAAWRHEPQAALMIHAGDLVNGRASENDTEWGEWFDAGSFLNASTFVVPAAGNHEHRSEEVGDRERYTLESHWAAQFPVPRNGAPGLPDTTYWFDYQGVRFITLDSTSAIESGTAKAQAEWMTPLLASNPNRWTVVSYHHPLISVSLGRDNPPLREHWQPVFERYGVDLVLQGHDHVYGRGQAPQRVADRKGGGPVYVVSIAGPKQYRVSKSAQQQMTRSAENTQLYQIVRVTHDALNYESWTVTGRLYDAFELHKNPAGVARLIEKSPRQSERRCPHDRTPSGRIDRCWDGTEW